MWICTTPMYIITYKYSQAYTFLFKYGWLKVAFAICCLGKTYGGIFWLVKRCRRRLSTGGMFWLLQRLRPASVTSEHSMDDVPYLPW